MRRDLKTWPKSSNGEPIFRHTNDAIFYAQLASNEFNVVDSMRAYRDKARRDLQHARQRRNPNLDLLMDLAVKAQFFRECYEEIERINREEKE